MGRRLFASLLAASVVLALGLLALGGCTGSGNPAGTSPDVSGASSPSPQPRTIDGCVGESDGAMFDYERSGTVTPAILLGTAGPGVVISYEANGDVCTWLPRETLHKGQGEQHRRAAVRRVVDMPERTDQTGSLQETARAVGQYLVVTL